MGQPLRSQLSRELSSYKAKSRSTGYSICLNVVAVQSGTRYAKLAYSYFLRSDGKQ